MKAKRMMTYVRSSLVLGLALGVMQANSATLAEVYRDVVHETQAEIAVAKEAVVTQREATKAMVKDQQTAEKAKQALAQDVAQLEADLMAAQARVKAARAVLEQEKAGYNTDNI